MVRMQRPEPEAIHSKHHTQTDLHFMQKKDIGILYLHTIIRARFFSANTQHIYRSHLLRCRV